MSAAEEQKKRRRLQQRLQIRVRVASASPVAVELASGHPSQPIHPRVCALDVAVLQRCAEWRPASDPAVAVSLLIP